MRHLVILAALGIAMVGCSSQPQWNAQELEQQRMFRPTAMRIHPVFTQVQDWSGDGRPDGFDVLVEFQDRFGDPTKASGNFVFEIFEYRPGYPDPRGPRIGTPFLADIATAASQRDQWNKTARCYGFQLAYPEVSASKTYVMTATFEASGGGRFEDRIVLSPAPAEPTTQPAK